MSADRLSTRQAGRPSVGKVPGTLKKGKTIGSNISYLLTHILFRVPTVNFAPMVAKYLAENEISRIRKNHLITGIYPYGVSLFTPINFYVPTVTFHPLVAKYLAESGVSILEKN